MLKDWTEGMANRALQQYTMKQQCQQIYKYSQVRSKFKVFWAERFLTFHE